VANYASHVKEGFQGARMVQISSDTMLSMVGLRLHVLTGCEKGQSVFLLSTVCMHCKRRYLSY